MDAVVAKAKEAQNFAASRVSKSFIGKGTSARLPCKSMIGLGKAARADLLSGTKADRYTNLHRR